MSWPQSDNISQELPPESVHYISYISHDEAFIGTQAVALDFHQLAIVDWDRAHNGQEFTRRSYTSWNGHNIVRLTLAIWILASHLAVVVLLLAKRALRGQSKNLLLANLALTNLVMGAFVLPVKMYFVLNSKSMQCDLSVLWMFLVDYYQPALSLFACLSLVCDQFIFVYAERKQWKIRPWLQVLVTSALVVSPWLLSAILLVPVFYTGLQERLPDSAGCVYRIEGSHFVASQVLSFLVPAVGVFVLAPFTGLLDCLRPRNCFYKTSVPRGEIVAVTAAVCLTTIMCEAPYCIVRVLTMTLECHSAHCRGFSEALTFTVWVRVCKASLFPFICLACTDIREAILCRTGANHAHVDFREEDSDVNDNGDQGVKIPLTQSTNM